MHAHPLTIQLASAVQAGGNGGEFPPSFEKFPPSFEKSQNWGGSFPPAFGWQNLKFFACGGLKLRE